MTRKSWYVIALVFLALPLAACGYLEPDADQPRYVQDRNDEYLRERYGTITGSDGITIFSTRSEERGGLNDPSGGSGGGIGVNAFLWRASLDTVDFMPLVSADPFGGVILTDWFRPPDTEDERLKVTIYIFSTALRADALKVTVFEQKLINGDWRDTVVPDETDIQLEDAILTRARQLKIATAEG